MHSTRKDAHVLPDVMRILREMKQIRSFYQQTTFQKGVSLLGRDLKTPVTEFDPNSGQGVPFPVREWGRGGGGATP